MYFRAILRVFRLDLSVIVISRLEESRVEELKNEESPLHVYCGRGAYGAAAVEAEPGLTV